MAYKLIKTGNIVSAGPSCKKKAYHSREEAEDMIAFIKETRVTRDIKPYLCSVCGFWHLTSKTY